MKEFIEIPFGAKDSELGGWEYNIPEGYTASIENDKIIVKKQESEDERIRKAILMGLIDCRDAPDLGWSDFGGIPIDDCIAWLEKQGEQKSVNYADEEIVEAVKDTSVLDMVEPNPAWSEEDISKLNKIATTIYEAGEVQNWWRQNRLIDKETANELNDWLKSLKERYTWKPSDEQLNALDEVYKTHSANNVCRRIIFNLLEQLKKL